MVQLVDEEGQPTGHQMSMPVGTCTGHLDGVLNDLLKHTDDDSVPYAYFVDSEPLTESLGTMLLRKQREAYLAKLAKEGRRIMKHNVDSLVLDVPAEHVVKIVYRPQAVFKVLPVTRCTAAMTGHSEAVLCCAFSPDSLTLATGSGDTTVRLWDVLTETPTHTLAQHTSWVQVLAWAPNSAHLLSGSKDGTLYIWKDGKGKKLVGHKFFVTAASWEPLHVNPKADRVVTSSKDGTLKMWQVGIARPELFTMNGHTACVTCVKWGGQGAIYSSSEDRSLIVWNAEDGTQRHCLRGHGHWVNSFSLSTEIVLRSGANDHTKQSFRTAEEAAAYAKMRYDKVLEANGGEERLVSCSDDHTLYLWAPLKNTKPLQRLTGHQDLIFSVKFSPDGTTIASSAQDKTVKLWRARDGKFLNNLRNHVGAVYHVAWSLDSRLVVSASKDATVKLWDVAKARMMLDLPGHEDEVYACDWSPDGLRVASGSKDKSVRLWKH